MDTPAVTDDVIKVTQNAANKVKALIQDEGNEALKLRVYVTGGGCSGFQYGFTFDENINEELQKPTCARILH